MINFSQIEVKISKVFSLRLSFSSSYLPTFSDDAFTNVGLCSFLPDFHPGDLVDKLREARLYITSLNRKSDAIVRRLAIISFRLNPSMAARMVVAFLFWRVLLIATDTPLSRRRHLENLERSFVSPRDTRYRRVDQSTLARKRSYVDVHSWIVSRFRIQLEVFLTRDGQTE